MPSRSEAILAPSAIACSLAQTTSSGTRPIPAEVSKPQSVAAMTRCGSPTALRDALQPVGDDFGVLDETGQIVDDAGGDDLVVGQRVFCKHAVFVLVARVGERQDEAADIRLLQDRQDVGERHVAVVRPLVIAPADMEAHPVARHVDDRAG